MLWHIPLAIHVSLIIYFCHKLDVGMHLLGVELAQVVTKKHQRHMSRNYITFY